MARARLLKPGFFTNEALVELPPFARLLFQGLWTIADREGRLEDRPRRIKMQIFPADDIDIEELLDMLANADLVLRYEVEGSRYVCIPSFHKHQKIHPREAESIIPAPDVPGEARPRFALGEPKAHLGSAEATPRCPEAEAVTEAEAEAEAEAVTEVVAAEVGNAAKAAKPAKRITKEFRERMRQEFPELDEDAEFEAATNHIAYTKRIDKQRYYQAWLRKSREYLRKERTNGRNGNDSARRAATTGTFAQFG